MTPQEASATHMYAALERCETLLDAVVKFIRHNPLAIEFEVHYDEADCDGSCLRDDCGYALEDVRAALAEARCEAAAAPRQEVP
jgi:hypothetical protein